jgi:hypothetical protein
VAAPSTYNRLHNFAQDQATAPTDPLTGSKVDAELNAVKVTLDQLIANLGVLQRADTALANETVGLDQLKAEVSAGINPPTVWATTTQYVVRDTVFNSLKLYRCLESHVSGVFATDLAAEKWVLLADFTSAASAATVSFSNTTSGLTAISVQDAIDEIDGTVDAINFNGRTGGVTPAASDYDADQIDFDNATSGLTATNVQAAMDEISGIFASGTRMLFQQTAAPTGWTKVTAHNNKALRIVSGTVGSGGSTAFTSVFGARTILQANLPNITLNGTTNSNGAHTHTLTDLPGFFFTAAASGGGVSNGFFSGANASSTDSSGAHTHTFSVPLGGSGTAMNFAVQYVDVIIAEKD